ncbi:discoidin domain-containing protein [uncultured Paludibaculum sp.]|uniref:discoidin domain-containing protein n=1 Tax=uncultured Paludibaculum sp. TaxID=1765020 RepID=UPI002AAA8D83|nr:discoidin domain-containing protein [uncultured Paludibaculum sp.]
MPKAVSILFGALFTIATAYGLGRLFLGRLKTKFAREEEHLFAFVAGAPLLSLLIFLLAAVHLIYDAAFLVVGILVLALVWKTKAYRSTTDRLPALPRLWQWTFWPVYAVFATVLVIYSMAPEWSPDGASYHLGAVSNYYRAHGFKLIASNMYFFLSQGLEMLFLFAWAFGRHSAAAMVHCAFLLVLPLLLLRYGQRQGVPAGGAAAGLFVLISPVVMIDGASAYNDVAVACVLFAIFYLCEIDAPPVVTGLLAGFCYALKYTAFVGLVYLLFRYAFQRRWRHILVACVPAACMILPWVLRNWIWTGNPFAPLLNAYFPNPFVHASFEADYTRWMRWYTGLESVRQIPLELTVKGVILGGVLGPLFLLTPLAILGLRSKVGRRALVCAVLFSLPYAANIGTRFLIPALPFWSLALAAGLPSFTLPVLVLAHAFLSFPDQPARYGSTDAWRISKIPFRQALRRESEEYWLSTKWPPYRVARMVEDRTPAGSIVYAMSPIADSYTTREIQASFQSGTNEVLRDNILTALIPEFQPEVRVEFRFPRQPFTGLRVVQTAAPKPGEGDRDVWSISEFRVLDHGQELPRSDDWRLQARPSAWEVQAAFDNSPLTRWRSWAWIRPGMFVEVTFGQPRTVDCVRLDVSNDQHAVRLKLEGRAPSGQWQELSHEPVLSGVTPPLGMRRMAMDELKRQGISYLLINEGDYKWEDFRDRAELWGLREAGHVDNVRLYKLE